MGVDITAIQALANTLEDDDRPKAAALVRDVATEIERLRTRVSELEDTVLLKRACDDVARSFGRNIPADAIARDILERRGENWSGASVEWSPKP